MKVPRTRAVRTAWSLIAVALLTAGVPAAAQPAGDPDVGVEVQVEAEAFTVQVVRVRSDAWRSLVDWIVPLLSMTPRTDVFEHRKDVEGRVLGLRARGRFTVLEVKRYGRYSAPSVEFIPVRLTLELPLGTLSLVFAGASGSGYTVESEPGAGTGVFRELVVRGELRVFGLSDRGSIVRGRLVLGFPDRAAALEALAGGLSGDDAGPFGRP